MPNWCFNEAWLKNANPARVDELENICRAYLKNEIQKETEDQGPFQFLFPMPDPCVVERTPYVIVNAKGEREVRENTMPDWWLWRNSNWGTKWEPSCLEIERISPNELFLQFDSAWGPPVGVYDKAHENGWEVTASYSEPMMGFAGDYENGVDNTYDLPATDEEDAA